MVFWFGFFFKLIVSKVLPYVSDTLFDMLDFSDFPQLFNYFFIFFLSS